MVTITSYNRKRRYPDWRDPPASCDCCHSQQVSFRSHDVLYGGKEYGDWPYIYYCEECEASVGCHPFSIYPLGIMADSATRSARATLHAIMDPMWKSGQYERGELYAKMAELLGLPKGVRFHTGSLSLAGCHAACSALRTLQTVDDFADPA